MILVSIVLGFWIMLRAIWFKSSENRKLNCLCREVLSTSASPETISRRMQKRDADCWTTNVWLSPRSSGIISEILDWTLIGYCSTVFVIRNSWEVFRGYFHCLTQMSLQMTTQQPVQLPSSKKLHLSSANFFFRVLMKISCETFALES